MLKKVNRIGRKKDFLEIKEKGKIFNGSFFGSVYLLEKDKEIKFGFIISKKISKKAVERNKIKRRISEVLRKKITDFKPGTRIIFLAKKKLIEISSVEIEKEISKLILKLNSF